MKILANNQKVKFDYFIEDLIVAGIVLEGWEVKPILSGKMSINESYVRIIGGELFVVGSHVSPTQSIMFLDFEPNRSRKLLVTNHQLEKWESKVKTSGYTLMLQDIHYSDKRKIKATLCLCRGKKQHDKRNTIKERDIQRELEKE